MHSTESDRCFVDHRFRCGQKYEVLEDGTLRLYETRCYIVDSSAHLVFAESFQTVDQMNTKKYQSVGLGHYEGAVMRDLVAKNFFVEKSFVNFQGECSVEKHFTESKNQWGLARTAKEQDNYAKFKGPYPRAGRKYQCTQNVVHYHSDNTVLVAASNVLTGTVKDGCGGGTYTLVRIAATNTYFVAIENWKHDWLTQQGGMTFNFGCHISNRTHEGGAYRIINGSCDAIQDEPNVETCPTKTTAQEPACWVINKAKRPAMISLYMFVALMLLCICYVN